MEDDIRFGQPRLVVGNGGGAVFKRALAAGRKRRQITVHREWNDETDWWVGHVYAGNEVYRIGRFGGIEEAYVATISSFYEIVGRHDQLRQSPSSEPSTDTGLRLLVDDDEDDGEGGEMETGADEDDG